MKHVVFLALAVGLSTLQTTGSLAQGVSSADLTCRSQAKEVAAQTYSTCLAESRNSQIDEIRKNYEKDLHNLKNKYDQELKKLGADAPATTAVSLDAVKSKAPKKSVARKTKNSSPRTDTKVSAKRTAKPKASINSLARTLPTKKGRSQGALPMHAPIQESQVIAVGPGPSYESSGSSAVPQQSAPRELVEREAAAMDQMEIIDVPEIEDVY